jgi:hypothetical protein
VIDHYDLHLVQDIGSGRDLIAEYIDPSNAEPGDNGRIFGVTTSANGPQGFGRLPDRG